MEVRRRVALMGGATALTLTLAGCGGNYGFGTSAASGTGRSGGTASGAPVGAAPEAKTSQRSLRAMTSLHLGRMLMDGGGRTLYRYDKDLARPSRSNCIGACAQTWPPARWFPDLKTTGVDRAAIGRLLRPDGTWQLTVGGWPLYRYAKDQGPGDALGQGMGGAWFVSKPNGAKTTAPAPGPAQTGGGYGGGGGPG
ncbi:hypothetical protein [Spirillospora sp. NPDC047279]|uniref:hypothetical protein n=1 Tax=Spirillospora sp. NPDC047279 TaxID=3155478 RepID=UPI0033C2723E